MRIIATHHDADATAGSASKATPGWENQRSAGGRGYMSPFTPHLMSGSEYGASEAEGSEASTSHPRLVNSSLAPSTAHASLHAAPSPASAAAALPKSSSAETQSPDRSESNALSHGGQSTERKPASFSPSLGRVSEHSVLSDAPQPPPERAHLLPPPRGPNPAVPPLPMLPPPRLLLPPSSSGDSAPSSSDRPTPATHNASTAASYSGNSSAPGGGAASSETNVASATTQPGSGAVLSFHRRQVSLHRAASGHQFSDTSRRGLLQPPVRRAALHGPASPETLTHIKAGATAAGVRVSPAPPSPDPEAQRLRVAMVLLGGGGTTPTTSGSGAPGTTTPGGGRTGERGRRASDASASVRDSLEPRSLLYRSVSPPGSESGSPALAPYGASAGSPKHRLQATDALPRSPASSSGSSSCGRDSCSSGSPRGEGAVVGGGGPDLVDPPAGHGETATLTASAVASGQAASPGGAAGQDGARVPPVALADPLARVRSPRSHESAADDAIADEDGAGFAVLMYAGSGDGGTSGIIRRVAPAAQVRYLRHKERVMRSRSVSENNLLVVISRRQQVRLSSG